MLYDEEEAMKYMLLIHQVDAPTPRSTQERRFLERRLEELPD